jgi:hypothetical protein
MYEGTQEAEATFRGKIIIMRMKEKHRLSWVDAVLGVCCIRCMLYSVYTVLGICCSRCLLYSVSTHDHGMERSSGMT